MIAVRNQPGSPFVRGIGELGQVRGRLAGLDDIIAKIGNNLAGAGAYIQIIHHLGRSGVDVVHANLGVAVGLNIYGNDKAAEIVLLAGFVPPGICAEIGEDILSAVHDTLLEGIEFPEIGVAVHDMVVYLMGLAFIMFDERLGHEENQLHERVLGLLLIGNAVNQVEHIQRQGAARSAAGRRHYPNVGFDGT